ncbi:MAG TPA: type VI secretion system-associated FHA domain protein TagH [Woeseiaceae bacterium]|nr:type VI secretion system-associated FHA domain protein TagH [Woeseiaceae bacterium]
MPLQLEIISEHRDLVGDDAVHEFDEDGGTIGRSLDSDWILPDPDRYISGRHATIDHRGGIWYLADTSTNGVYVNGEREPLGRGNPRRLFNGDHLRMGDFEFVVAIDRGESIAMPLEGEQTAIPEPLETPVAEVAMRSGVQLLDEEELAGAPDLFANLLESDTPTPLAAARRGAERARPQSGAAVPSDASNDASNDARAGPARRSPGQAAAPAHDDADGAGVRITAEDLFDTFLDGLGISRADLHADTDPADVLQNAGQVLREFVEGTAQMLGSRRSLKAAFRLDQTTILPRHNNPVKLAESARDSLCQLLVGKEGEYLGPRDSAREVCRDLVYHQDALIEAMRAAFDEFTARFDPDELVGAFRREGGSKPLFGFLERQKNWQMYCDIYPLLTEKGANRFPQIFTEEFVRVYERQIADFKRLDVAPAFQSTVKLEPRAWAEEPPPPRVAAVAAAAAAPATPAPVAEAARAPRTPLRTANAGDEDADDMPSIEFDDTFTELFEDEPADGAGRA